MTPLIFLLNIVIEIFLWENTYKTISLMMVVTFLVTQFSRIYILPTILMLAIFKNVIYHYLNNKIEKTN